MTQAFESFRAQAGLRFGRRRLIIWGVLALLLLIALLMTWNEFFVYVPPGKHLVIISKEGAPLPAGQVLAEPGEKGILREVKGEGWHFVMPIVFTTQVEKNTVVPPGKVGIVTARGGKPLPPGRVLAEPGEQGIQRQVLLPGTYRLNLHGYDLQLVEATDIPAGFVGVLRRLLGTEGKGRFAEGPDEKGILREVLQPGLYYINPKEYEVLKTEVGIFQTSFRYDPRPQQSTAVTFISKGGLPISMDCTIEWEILPQDMPELVAEYGSRYNIERNVIDVQAHAIGRDKGISYGVQDFLEGTQREKFQDEFAVELTRIGREKNVTVHSAFIRNIVIPETYLKPIRDKQIAAETQVTNKSREATAQSEADVEREQQMIQQKVAEVDAQTMLIVAGIDREVENIVTRTEAEVEKLKAEFGAQIAAIEAQRTQTLGEAEASVTKMLETAKSGLFQLKMEAFHNDGDAFLRYSLADQLNPAMTLRLFQSGPGTLWTNLDGKNANLFLPLGGTEAKQEVKQKPAATGSGTKATSIKDASPGAAKK